MTPFAFQTPGILLLLPLLIPVAWLLHRARRRRNTVHNEMGGGLLHRSIWRDRLRLAAVALLLLALARPGINPQRHSVSKSGRDVVFVLDVSQSMLAEDAYPSRLDAAKEGIRDALDSFRSERVALVIYAGSANILCPLTYDYDFVRYMLDQAAPRAVDFGGTTLLSAIEKCVDSVLSADRKGVQDLVVLTDGEDHGPQNSMIAELLKEHETGLLVIGIGDTTAGSRIPIEAEDGSTVYLKHNDRVVTTRLNQRGLRELARLSEGASYISAGTSAFDLAGIYSQHIRDKPVAGTTGAETYVVYSEIGFLFMGVALIFSLLAERKLAVIRPAVPMISALVCTVFVSHLSGPSVLAAEPKAARQFADAMRLQTEGRSADALEAYGGIESEMRSAKIPGADLSPAQLATMRFNQGLCHLALATAQAEAEPRSALSRAQYAQFCFLEACRMNPGFERAGKRLDPTARLIAEYEKRIQEEDEHEQELQARMQNLVKLLQELQLKQTALRDNVPARPDRRRARKRGQLSPETPQVEPETSASDSKRFTLQQRQLHQDGTSILGIMQELDQAMTPPVQTGDEESVSILREPLGLMNQVIAAQERAAARLQQWNTWPDARIQQQLAIGKIQEILDLLVSDNSGDSDEGDWEDDEEYDDMMEASDSDEAMMSSTPGQGDFASGSTMQPLPVPNYSVEDILMEEQGSLQFRQQQRAKSNQNKVEKDW